MKNTQLSRREKEKLRRRQEIKAAALRLFSEKGYHGVSVQEIAEKAEFAVGTLYNFFKSKGELYQEAMLEQTEIFFAEQAKTLDEPMDEVTKLRNLVRAKGEHFRENASRIRIFQAELRQASDSAIMELDAQIHQKRRQMFDKVASVFESGIKNGSFQRIGDPYHLAVILDGIIAAFVTLWIEEPDKHPFPTDPDVILNILFKGLIED
ncbi:MAG: TetR/AcrR family transcriptional regulator [Desulfatibacillum sp.]|nr:TetR/AcrR family transcriptional regulator [Desulfatibacillum sp.]